MESKDKKNKKYYEAMALVAQTLGKDEKIKNAWLKEISSIIVICESNHNAKHTQHLSLIHI